MFAIIIKLYFQSDYKDVPRLINILKKETKFLFPIGIVILGYQIFKAGSFELSMKTYNYILILFYIVNIFEILTFKFLEYKSIENENLIITLLGSIVFTPVFTIALVVATILGLK